MPTSRTAATLPTAGYSRPPRTDESLRVVTFIDEDGAPWDFDFSDLTAAPTLVDDLVAAVVAGSSLGGRWRTRKTMESAVSTARQFAANMATNFPQVLSISDITPEVWWAWRRAKEENQRWPGTINRTRALLSESGNLPDTTRKAMRTKVAKPRKRLPKNDAYSRTEFSRIQSAAKAKVRQAAARIETNLQTLADYRQSTGETDHVVVKSNGACWTLGSLLEYLAGNGKLPSRYIAWWVVNNNAFDLRGAANPAQAIFPSQGEIYCLMVLLVCERGFNLSVMDKLTIESFESSDRITEDLVHTVEIDKPRRGSRRYSAEVLTGDAGKLWETAVRITQPCRDTLAALGSPTTKLLVAHRANSAGLRPAARGNHARRTRSVVDLGPFRTDWLSGGFGAHMVSGLDLRTDSGSPLQISLQRLRLTEQVLNEHPRQNTDAISEDVYRRRDSSALAAVTDTIIEGQNDALAHAKTTVLVRSFSHNDVKQAQEDPEAAAAQLGVPTVTLKLILAGRLDTVAAACIDFSNSPFADAPGNPCPASFLLCLTCPNAVITPRHLPRLVALLDALDNVSSIVSADRWAASYAEHYGRLASVIRDNATAAEIAAARHSITVDERVRIEQLLNRDLDS